MWIVLLIEGPDSFVYGPFKTADAATRWIDEEALPNLAPDASATVKFLNNPFNVMEADNA